MFVSVIIPTHNRRESVLRAVEALRKQDFPSDNYEVIVACDRCTDTTEQALHSTFSHYVKVTEASVHGKTGALNSGLRLARGELAIFLDDDVEAVTSLISAHVAAQDAQGGSRLVVIGYSPLVDATGPACQVEAEKLRWQNFYRELEREGRENTPSDLIGANFSISVAGLHEVGGFNESYVFARDDFELAARLLRAGFEFRFCRAAQADMHTSVGIDVWLNRAEAMAGAEYRLAQEYPEYVRYLPLCRTFSDPSKCRRWKAAWLAGRFGSIWVRFLRKFAPENPRLAGWQYNIRYLLALRGKVTSWSELYHLFSKV